MEPPSRGLIAYKSFHTCFKKRVYCGWLVTCRGMCLFVFRVKKLIVSVLLPFAVSLYHGSQRLER